MTDAAPRNNTGTVNLSVIVPLYNEEKNIEILADSIVKVLSGLEKSFEIIFIDDGSTDNTFERLSDIAAGNPAKVIKELDPNEKITPRSQWYSNPDKLFTYFDMIDKDTLRNNTYLGWIRSIVKPGKND